MTGFANVRIFFFSRTVLISILSSTFARIDEVQWSARTFMMRFLSHSREERQQGIFVPIHDFDD